MELDDIGKFIFVDSITILHLYYIKNVEVKNIQNLTSDRHPHNKHTYNVCKIYFLDLKDLETQESVYI